MPGVNVLPLESSVPSASDVSASFSSSLSVVASFCCRGLGLGGLAFCAVDPELRGVGGVVVVVGVVVVGVCRVVSWRCSIMVLRDTAVSEGSSRLRDSSDPSVSSSLPILEGRTSKFSIHPHLVVVFYTQSTMIITPGPPKLSQHNPIQTKHLHRKKQEKKTFPARLVWLCTVIASAPSCFKRHTSEDATLVESMSPVFTCVPRESYCRGFRSRFGLPDDLQVLQTPFVIWSQEFILIWVTRHLCQWDLPDRLSISWFLDFNVLSTAQSHLKVNYNFILYFTPVQNKSLHLEAKSGSHFWTQSR